MRIFKYRTFDKWTKKQGLADDDLRKAIAEIEQGLIDANLGGNVYKKRIARQGKSKSGSYRTLLLMKQSDKVIFAHGFAKDEQGNITKNELEGFKTMATAFFNLTHEQLKHLCDNQSLIEINNE
jgi:hypothetical protein